MAERQHKHRDLWVALAVGLVLAGPALAAAIWATEKRTSLWPYSFILTGLGVYLVVALILGWWLPGGFQPGAQSNGTSGEPAEMDEPEARRSSTADPRISGILDLITEGRRLETRVPARKTWTMADKLPENIYRELGTWDRHAAEILDRDWLERFQNEPPFPPLRLMSGQNALVDHKIKSRLRVLDAVLKDLRDQDSTQD